MLQIFGTSPKLLSVRNSYRLQRQDDDWHNELGRWWKMRCWFQGYIAYVFETWLKGLDLLRCERGNHLKMKWPGIETIDARVREAISILKSVDQHEWSGIGFLQLRFSYCNCWLVGRLVVEPASFPWLISSNKKSKSWSNMYEHCTFQHNCWS